MSIFGVLYITLSHVFLLFFVGLWGLILNFVAFITVVFIGEYPKSIFEFQVQLMRWKLRVNARIYNLSDGYPAFGLSGTDEEYTHLEVPYPEQISRSMVLLRFFFGVIFGGIPHGFVLYFRALIGSFIFFSHGLLSFSRENIQRAGTVSLSVPFAGNFELEFI